MVAIPGVEDGLLGVHWDGSGLVKPGLGVVHLPGRVLVELLEVNGAPEGPHSVAPSVCSRTPRPRPAFTSSCQCSGMVGLAVADGSMFRLGGGPDIIGRGWCSQTLKVLAVYRFRRCCSSTPRLRLVGRGGGGGGGALVGHEQVLGGMSMVSLPD